MLDGAARIDELLKSAAEMGMPAIATTDHGYVFGAYEFWSKARRYGIKPIIGVEAYLTPGTHRRDKTRVKWGDDSAGRDDVSGGGAYTHMTLLARTTGGMHNLFRMSSLASLEGHYFKPRIDRELLSQYSDGLIATTGCVGGEIQTRLRLGQYDEARRAAAEFQDLFGKENFFAEVMDHGIPIERQTQRELLRLAKDLDDPAGRDQRPALHQGRGRQGPRGAALRPVRLHPDGPQPVQVRRRGVLPQDARSRCGTCSASCPEACDNTLLIAERCEVASSRARAATCRGSPARRGRTRSPGSSRRSSAACGRATPTAFRSMRRTQARYETEVILGKGYPGYFLVVADFINWAKDNSIRVGPGRGSGAGSMCAYAMRITDLDPVPQRPDLRAVPQPRAPVDARLRRRLRRAPAR